MTGWTERYIGKHVKKISFDVDKKWYKHDPEKVVKLILGRYYGILQYKLIMSLRREDLIW